MQLFAPPSAGAKGGTEKLLNEDPANGLLEVVRESVEVSKRRSDRPKRLRHAEFSTFACTSFAGQGIA